jgi:hypothetical protein
MFLVNIMKNSSKRVFNILIIIIFVTFCAVPERNNPNDPKSDLYQLKQYSISFTVRGLAGEGLVIQNTYSEKYIVIKDGEYTFMQKYSSSTSYDVIVISQPSNPQQDCIVKNGSGKIKKSNIKGIEVTCRMVSKDISSFMFEVTNNPGVLIKNAVGVIGVDTVEMNICATDLSVLIPSIEITGVSVNPPSGTAQGFIDGEGVIYTVTAEDGSAKEYTVSLYADGDCDGVLNTIEIANGTDPADANSYYEEDTPRYTVMIEAGFIYIPGGWDVDGDGVIEDGFYIGKYEAILGETDLTDVSSDNVPHDGTKLDCQKFVDETLSTDGNEFYNTADKRFSNTSIISDYLCDGTDPGTGTTATFPLSEILTVVDNTDNLPATGYTWFQARASCRATKLENGVPLDLLSDKQTIQIGQLIINNPQNWVGHTIGAAETLFYGHTEDAPSYIVKANSNDNKGYFGTGDTAEGDADQRRTLYISEGTTVRNCSTPDTCSSDLQVSSGPVSTHIKSGYEAIIWDISGNAREWTRGIFHKDDRFNGGDQMYQEYSTELAPSWQEPVTNLINSNILLSTSNNVGMAYDGASTLGGSEDVDVGYGTGYVSEFIITIRSGYWGSGNNAAGVYSLSLNRGPGNADSYTGFRCASR